MGFLSFLSKNPRDKSAPGLKTQAYHATVQSKPPVRGTYPVAGNGASMLHALQMSYRMTSQSQLPLDQASPGPPVPAIPISRLQERAPDRPNSAPNGRGLLSRGNQTWTDTTKPGSSGPSVSFRQPRTVSSNLSTHTTPPATEAPEPRLSHQSANELTVHSLRHSRHTSLRTMASGGGSIDILDAQSDIKPSNFRSRVQAAGVRDYGEDVADRNIGPNGVDLTSAPVQAFYMANFGEASTLPNQSVLPHSIAKLHKQAIEASAQKSKTYLEVGAIAPRAQSLTSSNSKLFPKDTTSLEPRPFGTAPLKKPTSEAFSGSERFSNRRKSTQSLVTTQAGGSPLTTASRPRPISYYSLTTTSTDPAVSWGAAAGRPRTSYQLGGNELGIYGTPLQAPSIKISNLDKVQAPMPKNKGKAKAIPPTPPIPSEYHRPERPRSSKSPSRRSSTATAIYIGPNAAPTKQFSTLSISGPEHTQSTVILPEASSGTPWNTSSRSEGQDGGSSIGRVGVESASHDAGPSSPAPSPHILRSAHSRNGSIGSTTPSHQRARSIVSNSGTGRFDDIYEQIPVRTSSLRHWSISSTTPSTSSSNPFGRPQSSHTANTSVDLAKFSSIMTSSRSSLDSRSHYNTMESRFHSPLVATGAFQNDSGFNIDDYLSSDDDVDADSFVTPMSKSHPVEEGLLFRDDGYGIGGAQLPGLFDPIVEVPSGSPPMPRSSHVVLPPYRGSAQRSKSLDSRSFAPGYDYDEEQPSDDVDDELFAAQMDLVPGRRNMKRLSALGLYGRIEEENLEKVDVRTAIRLRKEAKARKRASVARRAKGKAVEVVDMDEENHADGEL